MSACRIGHQELKLNSPLIFIVEGYTLFIIFLFISHLLIKQKQPGGLKTKRNLWSFKP